MVESILSFAVGFVFGALVTLLKLPLPAPSALAGVMGIVGLYAGYMAVSAWWKG